MSDVLDRFHQDLTATVAARVPLELGQGASTLPSGLATISKLDQLKTRVRERLAEGKSLRSVTQADSDLPGQYRAALGIADQCGTSDLAVEGMSARTECRRQLARVVRAPLLYVIGVLFFASVLLSFFQNFVAPSFENMREDLKLVPVINAPERIDIRVWDSILATAASGTATVLLILMMFGGSHWLASWIGGRRFRLDQLASQAIRSIDLLLRCGVPFGEAVDRGCDLVGDETTRRRVQSLLQVGAASVAGEEVSKQEDLADSPTAASPRAFDHLSILAEQLEMSAQQRLGILRALTPAVMVVIVGGTVTMLYCLALFLPLVEMLQDLAIPSGR